MVESARSHESDENESTVLRALEVMLYPRAPARAIGGVTRSLIAEPVAVPRDTGRSTRDIRDLLDTAGPAATAVQTSRAGSSPGP